MKYHVHKSTIQGQMIGWSDGAQFNVPHDLRLHRMGGGQKMIEINERHFFAQFVTLQAMRLVPVVLYGRMSLAMHSSA